MATDTTHLPQGELNNDASNDMAGSELEFGAVQLAQVSADSGQPVQLPQGQQTVLIPVQPGQTLTLPTDSPNGLLAKVGPEGNLAIVVDGRTIIFQGYVQANDQSPVRLVTSDGDQIDVADVVAATDSSLDIQTAAGPAAGGQGETAGSGIYTPFNFGPALGGLNAIGVLDPTALAYKNIDDERETFVRDRDIDGSPTDIEITFDILGGIVNEDDLFADPVAIPQFQAAKLVVQDQGNDGTGNDPFDGKDREEGGLDSDGDDGYPDADREPLTTVATVKVTFGPDIPGTLAVDETELPTGLTSEGQTIIYEVLPPSGLEGNGVVGFVDADFDGKYTDGVDRIVFDIKVQEKSSDSIFHVAFTLYDNIDNEAPDADGNGKADLLGANEQIVDLPVKITAADKDGTPMSTVMHLGVEDDVPFFGQAHYTDGEGGGIAVIIDQTDANIEHDESKGVQNSSDDQWPSDAQPAVSDATNKVLDAGFGLPYGDSEGSLWPKGVAQTQVIASFGADQASKEYDEKSADNSSARNSIFGALEDLYNADGDDTDDGENEHPFELFMIVGAGQPGATETSFKTPGSNVLQTVNLSIQDQLTNATVTWDGGEVLQVFVHQVDAHTIIGYVVPEGSSQEEALKAAMEPQEGGENGEAVFVLTIDDNGVMTFVQYHQLNHPDSPDNHDEEFAIKAADGSDLIHVRISDNDGDHAHQPVNLVVEDDGPKFKDVCFTHGNGTVDEDYLGKLLIGPGNHDLDNVLGGGNGDDQILDGTSTSGTINFSIGVDKPGVLSIGSLVITDSAGNPVDITALKTADGHGIDLVKSGPDGDGVITWTGVEQGSGDPVFTMKLDTSGGDMGDFKFTLNQALQHPFTDSDLNNDDNPDSAFEDNFNFAFNVVATDIDKDTAQGTINIKVDDDSPTALDDHDEVTEGKTGGNLNFASGNVVTGGDASFLGKDGNFTFVPFTANDGTPDLPGADRPYTISKLEHDGNSYELSPDGQSVSGLTDGDSYDAATGILKITTEEGGTFEIVMTSSNQSLVGEYRYTVPENADHDEDKHAGPANEADSKSAGFDTVGEWVDSFAAAGITLVANVGSLGLRDLNISGPEYRGIGVNSGNGDNSEVDNAGPNETLTLQIANPTDNIALTLGALYNGAPDAGYQEIVLWQVYDAADNLVASGQIVGSTTGLVTLDIDTNGVDFNRVVLTPVNNGAGDNGNNSDFVLVNAEICCPEDKFTEKFDYTLRDSDGDEDTASICIDVKDTEPKITRQNAEVTFLVDEDGLANGLKNSSPNDDAESTIGGNVDNDGIHKGKINFTPGVDPVTIELSVGNGGDTGLQTVDGKKVLAAWEPTTGTLIGYIEGTDPSDAANRVFTVHIDDAQAGTFTFTLLKPVEHPDSNPQLPNADENNPNLSFTIDFQIEDKDCDVAVGKMIVSIDDDMPVVVVNADSSGTTQHDETAGRQTDSGDDDQNGAPPSLFNVLGAGPAIGWAHDGDSVVNISGSHYGADGPGSTTYSLGIPAGNVDSGLDTTDGHSIWLFQGPNGIIVGREGSGADGSTPNAGGAIIFAVSIDGNGELTVVQYDSIKHPDNPNNYDEDIGLADGALQAVVTLTDADNDAVSGSANIGQLVRFDDDGPKAKIELKHDNLVQHDETAGVQNPGSGQDMDQAGALPAAFSGIAGTLIGWARSAGAVVTTSGSSTGSDDEGATTALSLSISGKGTDSGIDDTETGQSIFLFENGGRIEGRVGGEGGQVAFAVSINQDGTVDVAQYRALEHPDSDDHDESVDVRDGAIYAVVTVTDGDLDKATDKVDIGERILFDDDGPKTELQTVCGAQIVLDESTGPVAADGLPDNGGNPNDEAGSADTKDIAYAKVSGSALFFDVTDFGTDKAATSNSKVYELELSNQDTSAGLTDTTTGDPIYLHRISDTEIEGRVNTSGTDPVAFRITINPANGEVTISQYRAIEHNDDGSSAEQHDEATSPASISQGKLFVSLTVQDGDHDTASDTIDLGKLIKFEDDGPIARNDVDALDPITGNRFESQGNVITGAGVTTPGIDDGGSDNPWTISKLEGKTSDSSSGGGGYIVNGLYGQLVMQSNGSYVYNFDEANTGKVPSGSTEVFTYTLRDGDGDTDTATLTINMGEATVETSASVNNGAGGCIPEDTYGPVTLTADPGAGDRVTQITLTNVPAGWDIKDASNADFVVVGGTLSGTPTYNEVTHSIAFDITGAVAGANVSVTLQIKGAPDSDVDGTGLVVGATVVDGVVTGNDTTPFNVTVDAVADGDDKGDDGDADALGVTIQVTDGGDANNSFQVGEVGNVKITASFDDFKDGSETHTLLIQLAPGFTWNSGVVTGGFVTLVSNDPDTLLIQVDSNDSGNPGASDIVADISVTYNGGVQGNQSGIFSATVTATETPTDVDCNLDNNTDSATATTTVPLASPPEVNVSLGVEGNTSFVCVPEDTTSDPIPVNATTTAGSHLTTIVISGFPTSSGGFTFNFTGLDLANTTITNTIAADGKITITFDDAVTTNFSGSFTVTPPADSDVDLGNLTATATAVDNGDPSSTDTDADDAYVRVDAVADGDDKGNDGDADVFGVTISVADGADGNATFQNGEAGSVHVTASYDDFKDGSEAHKLEVTAPAGFQFNTGNVGTLPAGVTLDPASTGTHLIFIVDSKDDVTQNGVSDLTLDIPVTYTGGQPDGATGNFTATVTTTETPTDLDCDLTNNTDSATTNAATAVAKVPDTNVSLGVEGNADPICVSEDTVSAGIPVHAETTAGSHLTTIVISGFPTNAAALGWTFTFGGLDLGNTSVSNTIAADGKITITFDNASTTAFDGTFTVKAPGDSDLDLGTLTATVTAVNDTDPTVTDTDADTAYVRVDAVADGKGPGFGDDGDANVLGVTITATDSADGDTTWSTGEKGTLNVGATFDDFKDGSEVHTVTITAPAGFSFTGDVSGLPAGVTVQSSSAGQVVLAVDSTDASGPAGVGSFANVNLGIQNVSAATGVTVNFSAEAKAVEQNTTATQGDGNDECTDANNTQTVTTTAGVTTLSDLVPIAYDDYKAGTEPGTQNVNVLLILDNSYSMNDLIPDSGGKTRLTLLKEASAALLNAMAAGGGDVRVMIVNFSTGATAQSSWVSVAQAITTINSLTSESFTNYEAALATAQTAFADTDGRGDFATHDNVIYFMSDGLPTSGGATPGSSPGSDHTLTNANLKAWDNFLENSANSIDDLYAVGIGKDLAANDSDLKDVADPDYTPGDVDGSGPVGQVLIVANENTLKDVLIATTVDPIKGNILDGSIENDPDAPAVNTPDFVGDAPAHISYLKYDGAGTTNDITITWDGSSALSVSGGSNVTKAGSTISFDTDNGRMTFEFGDGDFSFVPKSITGGDKDEFFSYKLTDKDGDVSNTATLDVHIQDFPAQLKVSDVTVNEGGTANAVVTLSEPAPAGGVTVNYTFQLGGDHQATAGTDYAVVTASVFIAAGATTANIQVNGTNDAFVEGDEHYHVVITGVTGGVDILDGTGLVTIHDTDTVNAPVISHSEPSGGWPGSASDSGFNSSGNTKSDGGTNNDGWDGEGGDDNLSGGNGNDYLRGGDDDDTLSGGSGNDRLRGDADNDTLTGGTGSDLLEGGSGFDKLDGGDNNDWLIADADDFGAGRSIHGGSGSDVLDLDGIGNFTLTGKTSGVDGIEVINLEGSNADTLSLKASDVVDVAGGTLFIWGDTNDNVNLTNGGWTEAGVNITGNDGATYSLFQNGATKVYVDDDVNVALS